MQTFYNNDAYKCFPSISDNSHVLPQNLCEGEYYYIKLNGTLSHARIHSVHEGYVEVTCDRLVTSNNAKGLETSMVNKKYLTGDHMFSDYALLDDGHMVRNLCASVSHSNETIIIGTENNVVTVWSVISGDDVCILGTSSDHWILSVCFSPNDLYIAAGSTDSNAYIWCATTRALLHSVYCQHGFINSVSFCPKNEIVIMGCGSRSHVALWSMVQKKLIGTLKINGHTTLQQGSRVKTPIMRELFEENVCIKSCAFSADGSLIIATATTNGDVAVVALWRRNGDKFVLLNLIAYEEENEIYDLLFPKVCFSPSSEYVIVCCNGIVRMLSVPDLEIINTLFEPGTPSSRLNDACFSPSGDCIVANGSLGLIYVFDSLTLGVIATHTCTPEEYYDEELVRLSGVLSIEFSADGSKIVVCYTYGIREIPHKMPIFIPDEFRSQQVADVLSVGRWLPDNAKQAISEFLHGASEIFA